MTARQTELYLYWRLAHADVGAACAELRGFQRALELSAPGLQARLLLRRDEAGADTATLMETYAMPTSAQGLDGPLQRRIAAAGDELTARWRIGSRHAECFEALA